MIVKGDNVTARQAAEILIRTDYDVPDFSYAGNDRFFRQELNELFGFEEKREDEEYADFYDRIDELRKKYKTLNLDYLSNEQIVSSWIGGPHGWCSWDGTIGTRNYNIGKWPSVKSVAEDWERIAQAFPFLNLRCQLFDAETCEEIATPIVLFTVKDGAVVVEDSDEPIDMIAEPQIDLSRFLGGGNGGERGIDIHSLRDKIKLVYGE